MKMKMKIVNKCDINVKNYNSQSRVRRKMIPGSGYESIVIASDQDLD